MKELNGKIALVAGATRGAGRGIACMLGEAGATVYCTGRSTRGSLASGKNRPETIEETAEMVSNYGGKGFFVQTDHTIPEQVEALIDQIKTEQGRLDILVNDVWGGDAITQWGIPFWKLDLDKGFKMLEQAVNSHIITARIAAPLMLENENGLIIEITDGDSYGYRGNLFYDLVKTSVIRLAFDFAWELRHKNIYAVAVTPGFLRSEAMLDHFGVTEENWQEAGKKDPNFLHSETPYFVGRAVAALAADPNISEKSGRVFSSWTLMEEYDFKDVDDRQPNWGKHFEEAYNHSTKACDEGFYNYWFDGPVDVLFKDWP